MFFEAIKQGQFWSGAAACLERASLVHLSGNPTCQDFKEPYLFA